MRLFFHYLFGRFRCFFSGLTSFLKMGEWVSHLYMQAVIPSIIISTDRGFRVSNSYEHKRGETVHPNGGLIIGKCIYCGKESKGWCHDYNKYVASGDEIGTFSVNDDGTVNFFEKGKENEHD